MGVQQPGKAPGPSAQQIERQLQMVVNDALKVLDAATPIHPENQAEVDSLRSLIWSELTGLETEFGREGGPRADRVERFFHHLLSSGDYVGQIESLGSALLGGEPPPSQPAPGSPVAELHQLHSALTLLRKQWQQVTASSPSQPAEAAQPASAATPASNGHTRTKPFAEKSVQALPGSLEPGDDVRERDRRLSTPRPSPQPARKSGGMERLLKDLGFGNFSPTVPKGEKEPPLPRAIFTFIAVIIVLALFGVGVIYVGLSGGPQPGTGTALVSTQTITIPTITRGTPSPTPTLSAAPPQLVVQGENLQVPCANRKQSTGFILQNAGGKILSWNAKVNTVGGTPPVTLSASGGQLYGGSSTNTKVVTVTALVNTTVTGTITITSNGGTGTIHFQIIGC